LVVQPREGDLLVWSSCGERLAGESKSVHDYGPSNSSYHSGLEVEGPYDEKWILNMFFDSSEVSCHDVKFRGKEPNLERPVQHVIGN